MNALLLVGLGSALGGMARHGLTLATARLVSTGFPLATLAINVIGSFLIGLIAGGTTSSAETRLFLTTGVMGGFTTFSAFSLQTVELWRSGHSMAAASYVVLSVAGSIAACFAGFYCASMKR